MPLQILICEMWDARPRRQKGFPRLAKDLSFLTRLVTR